MSGFWVYMLKCSDGTLYTGCTKDVGRRLSEHLSGKGSKYTRSRLPVTLCYVERAPDWGRALSREAEIKKLSRSSKLLLCSGYARAKRSIR